MTDTQAADATSAAAYSCSPGLPGFLAANNIFVAVSSYQSGKLYLLGRSLKGGLNVHERFFRRPWD